MRRVLLFVLLILLAACRTEIVVVTSTPLPATAAPTETATPTLPTSTPTVEGCQPGEHCNFLGDAINPNYPLDPPALRMSAADTTFMAGIETITHVVHYPAPEGYYRWRFNLTGLNGAVSIPGWIPNVYFSNQAYQVNISSTWGKVGLELHQMELQDGQKYVVALEYWPEVFTVDPTLAYSNTKGSWVERCEIMTDTGMRYLFAPQTLRDERTAWNQRLQEEMVISFRADRDMTVVIYCGLELGWAAWEGNVYFNEFRLVPVDWSDNDIQKIIR